MAQENEDPVAVERIMSGFDSVIAELEKSHSQLAGTLP